MTYFRPKLERLSMYALNPSIFSIITLVLLMMTMSILLKNHRHLFRVKRQNQDLNPGLLGSTAHIHSNTSPENDHRYPRPWTKPDAKILRRNCLPKAQLKSRTLSKSLLKGN